MSRCRVVTGRSSGSTIPASFRWNCGTACVRWTKVRWSSAVGGRRPRSGSRTNGAPPVGAMATCSPPIRTLRAGSRPRTVNAGGASSRLWATSPRSIRTTSPSRSAPASRNRRSAGGYANRQPTSSRSIRAACSRRSTSSSTSTSRRGSRAFHKADQPPFQLAQPDVDDLERTAEELGDGAGPLGESRIPFAPQVADVGDVVEVGAAQEREPPHPEPLHHGAVPVAHEPVGQEEGPRARPERLERRPAPEHLIAVGTGGALDAAGLEHGVERTPGPAVAVDHDDPLVPVLELLEPAIHLGG